MTTLVKSHKEIIRYFYEYSQALNCLINRRHAGLEQYTFMQNCSQCLQIPERRNKNKQQTGENRECEDRRRVNKT